VQGGNLQNIVTKAGITKGALFHHFSGKLELGYAVVDEVIEPLLMHRWLDPLKESRNSLAEIQHSVRHFVTEDIASGTWHHGCPLNNLAQEMSPLDAGFHSRIDRLYGIWRAGFSQAITAGIAEGTVLKSVSPDRLATFVVASQMGVWGTGKSSRSEALMIEAAEALCEYLESLRVVPGRAIVT
ncbi:MAG: TetR/AcrR family transcriptional regulator, partial [Gemmatimonadaceae bacterium]